MRVEDHDPAAGALLRQRAEREWLRGEGLQALVPVGDVEQGRYRVRGLDPDGLPRSWLDTTLDAFTDPVAHPGIFTAVQGDHPQCAAVGLYAAARYDHVWMAITPGRLAVLRLRDVQEQADDLADDLAAQAREGQSLGKLVRGVGRLVKASAAELTTGRRRPPLTERPQDAVLECPFEVPRAALQAIVGWKPPLMPTYDGGPGWMEVRFTDGSMARLTTDAAGAAALGV
jgi:hypothetical protein